MDPKQILELKQRLRAMKNSLEDFLDAMDMENGFSEAPKKKDKCKEEIDHPEWEDHDPEGDD